jgi:hypothetical protein
MPADPKGEKRADRIRGFGPSTACTLWNCLRTILITLRSSRVFSPTLAMPAKPGTGPGWPRRASCRRIRACCGADPDKVLRLAKMNVEVRNTPRARGLLAQANAAIANFKGALTMARHDQAVECRTLVRSCWENLFLVDRLLQHGAAFVKTMRSHEAWGRISLGETSSQISSQTTGLELGWRSRMPNSLIATM